MAERTVITGGAGFIGSHLCDYFLAKGHEVICVDNLLTGRADNLAHLIGRHERFQFLKHDLTQFIHISGKVDNVLHFASPASPNDYLRFPIETLKVGAMGTHKALGLALGKTARFLLASTSEAYGDPQVHPQPEDYWGHVNPVGPRGVYDEAKRFAEALTMAYQRSKGLDSRIVRIFNTYGPRMKLDDGRALPTFIVQALKNQPLTVYGDGSQTRSFCYIDDLLEGIWLLLHSEEHEPVNLGNPDEITILEFAREIVDVTGSKSEIAFRPLPQDDPHVRQPDIAKARRILGWQPKVDRREGLLKTVRDFRRRVLGQ